MHKSKLSQNFYTIGRNNELKETSSNLDSSKVKSIAFTATSDDYAQIAVTTPGTLICAVSSNYLLVRQANDTCRVIGNITNAEISYKANVEVSGIAFYI